MQQEAIVLEFPGLLKDSNFQISSPRDETYNCIAWACIKNDIWYWPDPNVKILDGVYWPDEIPLDTSADSFIKLYNKHGYEKCDSWKFEDKFSKVAIYQKAGGGVSHAARQLFNGLWTSKLGKENDIRHTTPFSIEGDSYGKATIFMKRKNSSYLKSKLKAFIETI